MITYIEANRFRCFRYIRTELNHFQILVGPNASGKSSFFDIVSFLSDLVTDDLDSAIQKRTSNFRDLLWMHTSNDFEIAVEVKIPESIVEKYKNDKLTHIRYAVSIGINPENKENSILNERLWLIPKDNSNRDNQRSLFPAALEPDKDTIVHSRLKRGQQVLSKVAGGNDNYYPEIDRDKKYKPSYKLGPRRSALKNVIEDESMFPAALWLKQLLDTGIKKLVLNSEKLKKPSPPGKPKTFLLDGSNLPWLIEDLKKTDPERFSEWIIHLRTALPEINSIKTIERPEDRNRYLVVCNTNGLEVPSWNVSDGTLRLLALTIPAYMTNLEGIFLIEEPENGIHPKAVDTVFASLQSVYNAQVLVATHSPVFLSITKPNQILCFSRTADGIIDVINGDIHPTLKNWQGETDIGTLFAGGFLE